MRLSIFLSLLLISVAFPAFAQKDSYKMVDSTMRNYSEKIKSVDDLHKLIYFIRKSFQENSLRLRAGFIWITENIAYDIEAYQKEDPKAATLQYVIKNKKAICGGYSALLKYLCDAFNIESTIVSGRARAGKRDINIAQLNFRINHSWNAVKINNEWKLIDPTWASGFVDDTDEENLKYYKAFNETYYFTPPERFILNHYPKDNQFQFLEKKVIINEFSKRPLYYTAYLKDSISVIAPDTALLKFYKGDTIVFKIKKPLQTQICVASENRKAEYSGFAIYKNDWYEFHYPVTVPGFYNLHIGYCLAGNPFTLLSYKLQVDQKR